MKHPVDARRNQLIPIAAGLGLSVLVYASGNFGVLNVLGIRRIAQIALMIPVLVAFILSFSNVRRRLFDPIWLLAVLLLIRELVFGSQWIDLFNAVVLVMVVQAILAGNRALVRSTLVGIVCLAAIFSLMGLIQAAVYFAKPELIDLANRPYSSETGADTVYLSSGWQYLGFNAADEGMFLFGRPFTRLNSFGSEPSVLVSTLLVPGLLGLTLGGAYRLFALVILVFVIGPVQGGTIWLSCAIGAMLFFYFSAAERFPRLLMRPAAGLITVASVLALMVFLQKIDTADFTAGLVTNLDKMSAVSSTFGSKTMSSEARLTGSQEAYAWVVAHPFGSLDGPAAAGMALIYAVGYLAGYIGMALCVWCFVMLLQQMADVFRTASGKWAKVAISGCGGALLQAFFFSGYGWITPAGFIMFALIRRWLVPACLVENRQAKGRPLLRRGRGWKPARVILKGLATG